MIRFIRRRIRALQIAIEASRRELRLHDEMMFEGETWSNRQWRHAMRRGDRLYRVSCGRSPWIRMDHEVRP